MNKRIICVLLGMMTVLSSCKKEKPSSKEEVVVQGNMENSISQSDSSKITDESVIEFDNEGTHDFKEVKKGEEVTHVFSFRNTGKKPLIISEVRPSCGCTTPKYTKTPVAPGRKGSITVTFDSSNFAEGTIFKTVAVSGNFETKIIKFQAKIN